jgi:hypothetical protein
MGNLKLEIGVRIVFITVNQGLIESKHFYLKNKNNLDHS